MGYEKLAGMVILGGGMSNVVWEWTYTIEVVREHDCVHGDCFGVFNY